MQQHARGCSSRDTLAMGAISAVMCTTCSCRWSLTPAVDVEAPEEANQRPLTGIEDSIWALHETAGRGRSCLTSRKGRITGRPLPEGRLSDGIWPPDTTLNGLHGGFLRWGRYICRSGATILFICQSPTSSFWRAGLVCVLNDHLQGAGCVGHVPCTARVTSPCKRQVITSSGGTPWTLDSVRLRARFSASSASTLSSAANPSSTRRALKGWTCACKRAHSTSGGSACTTFDEQLYNRPPVEGVSGQQDCPHTGSAAALPGEGPMPRPWARPWTSAINGYRAPSPFGVLLSVMDFQHAAIALPVVREA